MDVNNGGGNIDMATAYLTRWAGPVNETDDPYNPRLRPLLHRACPSRNMCRTSCICRSMTGLPIAAPSKPLS